MSVKSPTENISISVPSHILEEIDEICGRRDLNRSSFFVRAVKRYIAVYHSDDSLFWEYLSKCREKGHVIE